MKPYILWIMFDDPNLTVSDDDDEAMTYFYQCILVAQSESQALEWANTLATELVKQGEASVIREIWIEEFLAEIISSNGTIAVDWLSLSPKQRRDLCQGTASLTKDGRTINAAIQPGNGRMARQIWEEYLADHRPEYTLQTCNLGLPPIVRQGELVDWNS